MGPCRAHSHARESLSHAKKYKKNVYKNSDVFILGPPVRRSHFFCASFSSSASSRARTAARRAAYT